MSKPGNNQGRRRRNVHVYLWQTSWLGNLALVVGLCAAMGVSIGGLVAFIFVPLVIRLIC